MKCTNTDRVRDRVDSCGAKWVLMKLQRIVVYIQDGKNLTIPLCTTTVNISKQGKKCKNYKRADMSRFALEMSELTSSSVFLHHDFYRRVGRANVCVSVHSLCSARRV